MKVYEIPSVLGENLRNLRRVENEIVKATVVFSGDN